ncbi:MAG: glycosyltransferase family 4 protein [Runella sp.]
MLRKIVFLPDAGPENPFQYQLAEYLRNHGFEVHISQKYTLGSTFRSLRKHRPDVVYYDWVHSFIIGKSWGWSVVKSLVFVLEILYAIHIQKVRIVHTLHNLQNHAGLWLRLERVIYGLFLRRCHWIRVYSEATKQAAIKRFGLNPHKIRVIQDLPYHFYYKNTATRTESRNRLGIDIEAFVYLFFGEMKPYKGLHQLIEAYKRVASPNTHLLIAGKSYEEAYWQSLQQAAHGVSGIKWYHRFIEDDEVQYFFNAADVVVLPFVRIDHSGSIDLAMSFGKPVITLKTESTQKLLVHQTELLFETSEELADCLVKAPQMPLEVIGKRNFEIADATDYPHLLTLFEP